MIFLIVYDTKSGSLLRGEEFEEEARNEAMGSLRAAQEMFIDSLDHIEIALFEADSRATLEHTHSRYFKSLTELGASLSDASKKSA